MAAFPRDRIKIFDRDELQGAGQGTLSPTGSCEPRRALWARPSRRKSRTPAGLPAAVPSPQARAHSDSPMARRLLISAMGR